MHTDRHSPSRLAALALLGALALGVLPVAHAQNSDPVVYTVGNTYDVGGGKHYAYLLWQPGDATTTFGKSFAVYRKEGAVASPNPYARLSVQALQTSPSAIHAMLKVGGMFDANGDSAAERINLLYSETTLQSDEVISPAPTGPNLLVAQQLATMLEIAKGDPKVLQRLMFLGRAHPGVMIAMGHAFAIKVTPTSLQTYEVREIDGGGNDLRVIGRVTLDAASPLVLPKPGRAVAVPHATPDPRTQLLNSGKDHLACRFRWGMPNPLRRLAPHIFGYNLYRVKKTIAVSLGWIDPLWSPATQDLLALIQASSGPDPDAKRVNFLPIIPDTVLSELEAADLADRDTIFTHDDNDPPDNPFVSGDDYYYFVAARDIAGHPGPCSAGSYVIYCDRLPPPTPTIESIINVFTAGTPAQTTQLKGHQHFRIRINQLPESPPENAAAKYWIYRWTYSQEPMFLGGNPLVKRIAEVNHVAGQRFLEFDDTGAGAPVITPGNESQFGITHWYTVRAQDAQAPACTPFNLSGHSPPLWGVLRDRKGPGRATGTIFRCLALPIITPDDTEQQTKDKFGIPENREGFMITVDCQDSRINSFDVHIHDPDFQTRHYGPAPGIKSLFIPIPEADGLSIQVRCRTKSGLASNWSITSALGPPQSPRTINVYRYHCTTQARYTEIDAIPFPQFPPVHEFEGPNGAYSGTFGTINISTDTREWRVYRRTGPKGPYELIARAAGDELPAVANWSDTAPPTVNDTLVCYFGQLFDENGNAGPLTQLGCFNFTGGTLPIPILEDIEHVAAAGSEARVKIKWFCDSVGVDRFEVWAAIEGGDDPAIRGIKLSPSLDPASSTVIPILPEGEMVFTPYQSPRVANGTFNTNGADFELTLFVPSGKKVFFAVRAVTAGEYDNRTEGSFSNVVSDYWQEPRAPNHPVIPWPDRPLPGIQDLDYDITKCVKGEGPFYAQKFPDGAPGAAGILVGSFLEQTGRDGASTAFWADRGKAPIEHFFGFRDQKQGAPAADDLQSIIPFAVYRHQVPSASNPNVVPNLVQVTPLIDRIAYKDQGGYFEINDPFFINPSVNHNPYQLSIPTLGIFKRTGGFNTAILSSQTLLPQYLKNCDGLIMVIDRLPVIEGSHYQYLLVHFDDRGEVERVIPTNIVQQ
jgi:hypothetical protein